MKNILVIEDNDDIRKLLQTNLDARGYGVILAKDGKSALAQLANPNPDLVLLDIKLPDISGWDVLSRIKTDNLLKHIPVIIMTGSERPGDDENAVSMGAACYISKPFSLRSLLIKIDEIIRNSKVK